MSKNRFYLIAGVLMVVAALALVGARTAQAGGGSTTVTFDGATPGNPCANSFTGDLTATGDAATVISNTANAGGTAPECVLNNSSLTIFTTHGRKATSVTYNLYGGVGLSWHGTSSLAQCVILGSGHFRCTVPGGFTGVTFTATCPTAYLDNLIFTFASGGAAETEATVAPCTDARINCHLYDDQIVLYGADNGTAIDVFMVDGSSEGQYLFTINAADFGSYLTNPPAQDMLIKQVGDVSVYVLTTGEVQVNYGPDANGKTYVIIMSGIGGGSPYGYTLP